MNNDLLTKFWLDRWLPAWVKPYTRLARWDRPIGVLLLLYPGLWGLTLASPILLPLKEYFLFMVGAILMRGAGCTYNDLVDHKYDGKVSRTSSRPLPSQEIRRIQAIFFLLLQLFLAALILFSFPKVTIQLGLLSLVLIAVYPWMKRITYWPQAFLGLTFNWGVLMGWTILNEKMSSIPFLFYMAGFFWTLCYDTIYAHQDREDDLLLGLKSTAITLGAKTYPFLSLFFLVMILFLIAGGFKANFSWSYSLAVALVTAHALWQLANLDIHDSTKCLRLFKANHWIGLIVLIGIIFSKI
ncbi:MAG: 4-hydroxybenzoate polyprenyltransferase [Caedibacter sp. 37-49]|nr:MAG: 4-hydroxybenzoate polyprenyltransferase [Caedibacter sp. 37-49]